MNCVRNSWSSLLNLEDVLYIYTLTRPWWVVCTCMIYIYKYLVDFFYNFVVMQLQVGSTKFGNAARGAGCHVINYWQIQLFINIFFSFSLFSFNQMFFSFIFFSHCNFLLYLTTLFIFLCSYCDRSILPMFFLYKHYFLSRLRLICQFNLLVLACAIVYMSE